MITQDDIIADMHTHTMFSEHAFCTVMENIAQAQKMNMKYLGITDHYYNKGDEITRKNEVSRIMYMQDEINSYEEDIKIIGSAEFNLNQENFQKHEWERLDKNEQQLNNKLFEKHKAKYKKLKWRPVGLHTWFADIESINLDTLYSYYEEAADEKYTCFCHIEREIEKIDGKKYYDKNNREYLDEDVKLFLTKVVKLAAKEDIYLEVNEGALVRNRNADALWLRYWLELAKELRCHLSLGTDAHYAKEVGDFTHSIELLNEINYPKELILNCNEEVLKELIK